VKRAKTRSPPLGSLEKLPIAADWAPESLPSAWHTLVASNCPQIRLSATTLSSAVMSSLVDAETARAPAAVAVGGARQSSPSVKMLLQSLAVTAPTSLDHDASRATRAMLETALTSRQDAGARAGVLGAVAALQGHGDVSKGEVLRAAATSLTVAQCSRARRSVRSARPACVWC
jgi:hypothetical protein